MKFNLLRACGNCPFKKKGAIELHEGRLEDIIRSLEENDTNSFYCHKSVYSKHGGETVADEGGEERYCASGNEQVCAGSMIYLLKRLRPSVAMRLAMAMDELDAETLMQHADEIIDPDER